MKNPKTKLILAFVAVFVLGGLSGAGLTTFCHAFFFPHPPRHGELKNHLLAFLTDKLNLTADQQEKIKPIAADFASQAEAARQQSVKQFQQLADATDNKIAALLTPEQKAALDKIRQDRNHDFQRDGGPPFGHPPGPPPGFHPGCHPPGGPPPDSGSDTPPPGLPPGSPADMPPGSLPVTPPKN